MYKGVGCNVYFDFSLCLKERKITSHSGHAILAAQIAPYGGTIDRVIDAFAPLEGLALPHIEDDRSSCSIGVLMAFDDGAAQTLFLAPSGHLTRPGIKK